MPSGALYVPRVLALPRHRGARPTVALLLVDWWLRHLLPFLLPARPGPVLVCPQCLAEPHAVRRADDGRLPCYLCGRIPTRAHKLTVPPPLPPAVPMSGRPFQVTR